jgi:hypothetical protein
LAHIAWLKMLFYTCSSVMGVERRQKANLCPGMNRRCLPTEPDVKAISLRDSGNLIVFSHFASFPPWNTKWYGPGDGESRELTMS